MLARLGKGVLAGVGISLLMFGWQVAQIRANAFIGQNGMKVYNISGQLFLALQSTS